MFAVYVEVPQLKNFVRSTNYTFAHINVQPTSNHKLCLFVHMFCLSNHGVHMSDVHLMHLNRQNSWLSLKFNSCDTRVGALNMLKMRSKEQMLQMECSISVLKYTHGHTHTPVKHILRQLLTDPTHCYSPFCSIHLACNFLWQPLFKFDLIKTLCCMFFSLCICCAFLIRCDVNISNIFLM